MLVVVAVLVGFELVDAGVAFGAEFAEKGAPELTGALRVRAGKRGRSLKESCQWLFKKLGDLFPYRSHGPARAVIS